MNPQEGVVATSRPRTLRLRQRRHRWPAIVAGAAALVAGLILGAGQVPATAAAAATADASAAAVPVLDVDFASGSPVDHVGGVTAKTFGKPAIATDPQLHQAAATFNGTSDAYSLPFADQWPKLTSGLSIECLFRYNGPSPSVGAQMVCADTNGGGTSIRLNPANTVTFQVHTGGAYREVSSTIASGQWYDVIGVWDGTQQYLYVNGALAGQQPTSGTLGLPNPVGSRTFTIGGDSSSTGGFETPAAASVARARVWSGAITADQAQESADMWGLKPGGVAVTTTPITSPNWYAMIHGALNNDPNAAQINVPGQLPVDPSWNGVTFTGQGTLNTQVFVAGYDQYGNRLSSSGWVSLTNPFTYGISPTATSIRYGIKYAGGAAITATDRPSWVKIAAFTFAASPSDRVATTDPQFHSLEPGGIDPTTGQNAEDAAAVRLKAPAAIDPSWRRLRFTGASGARIAVTSYDHAGAYLGTSDWQELGAPYTYTLPAGTAQIAYTVKNETDAGFGPDSPGAQVGISLAPLTTDPEFTTFASGAYSTSNGTPAANKTRVRVAAPVPVDPAWKSLEFSGDADQVVEVFAYDAKGRFLPQVSSGVQAGPRPLATPFYYAIPAHTAYVSYMVWNTAGTQLDPAGRSSWVTVTVPSLGPNTDYTLTSQDSTADFSIPGIANHQGGNFVDGELWSAQAPSDDQHQDATGQVNVYAIDYATRTSKLTHSFAENFGHLNSFSWNPTNNDLIFGNGSGDWLLASEFYVVNKDNIDLDGTNTLASVHATTFKVPASFGWKVNVIWTDQPDVAVMISDDAQRFYKIQLATGTDHFDNGDYTPAAAGQYNGTYKVLDSYEMHNPYYFFNGAAWVHGKLVMVLSEGFRTMAVVDLGENNTINSYHVIVDPHTVQPVWETPFYDPTTGYWGAINATSSGPYERADFWKDTNFTLTNQSVTKVVVTPANASVGKGGSRAYTAEVSGDDNPAQTVTWSIANNTSPATTISADGVLSVAPDEDASAITVTATSTVNPAMSGETQAIPVTDAVSADAPIGGTVPATLSLSLGPVASFGALLPGVGKDYTAQTTATVVSTAGDAALTYSDPGHLTNGEFALPEPLAVELSKAAWTGPVANDAVGITFKQHINANDPLRTGTYSKTLTFTLSTTNP